MKRSSEFALELSLMREEVAASNLLPKAYARYRPLLADGLRFFLERLSSVRLRRIFAEQMRLPVSVSTAERVVALLHHVPALHKLGQVVARDRRLNRAFRTRLQRLESLEPRTPVAEVVRLLEGEFKDWRKAGIKLGPEPLAEGSVAVVMPFEWPRSPGSERSARPPRQGVFKLLKPGIKGLLEEDLAVLGLLGDFLDEDCGRYHLPQVDYRETFDTIKDLLLHEVRLDEEQRHLVEAARMYASMPSVSIPALYPLCTARLTAMERLPGDKIASSDLSRGPSGRAAARVMAEALIATPLFSSRPAALFHADPHAGNLLVDRQGRIGILDWSLTGRLGKRARIELVQLLLGALTLDLGRMERAIANLALKQPAPEALREVLRASLRALRRGASPGAVWLTELLDSLVMQAGVRFDGDLLLFRKSLLTLEGVVADLMPPGGTNRLAVLDEAMLGSLLRHWAAEWPERFSAPFHARSFVTHLSNADLLSLIWSSPMTLARWWGETSLDLLQAIQRGKARN